MRTGGPLASGLAPADTSSRTTSSTCGGCWNHGNDVDDSRQRSFAMIGTTWRRTILSVAGGLMATGLLLGVSLAGADHGENTLLVWASDKAHIEPDFVAVIDFDRDSRTYGKVLRTVPLSGASAFSNEPHHVGLSRDGRTLALGGLLSVLRGQDQVFFFDVSDPRNPNFIRSHNPPDSSITDEFAALNNGGFLVTFMGGGNGAQPGRVVEHDPDKTFM